MLQQVTSAEESAEQNANNCVLQPLSLISLQASACEKCKHDEAWTFAVDMCYNVLLLGNVALELLRWITSEKLEHSQEESQVPPTF